ncbi:F-box/WD repeat-containing protein 7-like [Stylophora pistillata]|uniref:F-box/WD repeat-containing protein 7-like n=1 Tax=Stylophora pistillata TaxID=50429 RepID=UPI000C03A145|nr:F-box/WD repeat-containing protein 7-like [Stylophora pistillata]
MSFEERAKVFVNTFKDFNRDQQNEVLKRILLACQPLQLRLLYNGLKPLLAVDFVASLPKELVERIFSYLSVKSLCRVAQCNKLWRERSNHNAFWYRFCIQKGWDRFGEDLLQMPHTLISQKSNASLTNNTCTGLKPATCRWKEIYTRALSLDKNWEQGRYSVAPLLRGHKDPITCMTCDGSTIVSGSSDNTVRVWDVRTAKCGLVLDSPHTDSVRCVQLKDSLCASGCADGVIRLFDLKSGRCLRSFQGHTGAVEHLSFVGSTIISASADLTVRVWNSDTGALLRTMTGHSDEIQLEMASVNNQRLFEFVQPGVVCTISCSSKEMIPATVFCCDFNEKKIISGGGDGLIKIWDAHTGDNTFTLVGHTGEVYCLQFTDDIIASGSADSTVRLWSHQGILLHTLEEHIGVVRCLCLSGNRLISGGDRKRIALWDVKEGKLLNVLHRNPTLLHLMWADETKLITASPDTPGTITIINYW